MKKYLLLVIAVALTGCDGVVDPNTYPLMQPSAEYELDTWGSNSEVYEFTPKTAPDHTCVVFLTDSSLRPAMQCMRTPQ